MRLLLDTQVLLWCIGEPERLTDDARDAIRDPSHDVLVSAASVWECAIKLGLGKLVLPGPIGEWLVPAIEELGAELLPISALHAASVAELPPHHRDPFDRMLIAQGQLEGCTLVTRDRSLGAYALPILWA